MLGINQYFAHMSISFTGCDICHFGKDGINLNEKPWDDYNNNALLLTSNF